MQYRLTAVGESLPKKSRHWCMFYFRATALLLFAGGAQDRQADGKDSHSSVQRHVATTTSDW